MLVGNSTGGHLAILEAAVEPENVAGLILVDPAVPIPIRGSRLTAASMFMAPLLVRGLGEALLMADARRVTSEQMVYRTLKAVSTDYTRIPADVVEAHVAGHRARTGNPNANIEQPQSGRSLHAGKHGGGAFAPTVGRANAPERSAHSAKDRVGARTEGAGAGARAASTTSPSPTQSTRPRHC